MFKFFLIFLILHAATRTIADGTNCGKPGRPSNGTISPLGNSYFPGEKVTYGCIEGFVLFGGDTRTCQKNGSWSGNMPLCDFNLAREKRSLQSDTLWSYSPELAVDGNADTCSFTPRSPEPRWWQVHLGHKFNIVSVGITISPGSFQEFTIYVIELLEGNKALYKPCTTFKGVFQTHKGMFKCNDGIGHPGQFVYVRDDRKEEEYFGLCEVEVFAYRDRIPCGDPEVPVKATATKASNDQVSYTCSTGYKLDGNPTLLCLSKGKWQGKVPKCNEVKCSPPLHIENGYIEIGNSKGEYVYGTKAKYGCSPGHHLNGLRVRTCSEEGDWSGVQPSCQAVSCGPPPTFPKSRYTLINGSNQWAGIVVYSCEEGYTLRYQNEDTVTTCLDNGEWKFINVSCIAQFMTSDITREDHGRAINYEEFKEKSSGESMSKLVIALAVIATVLAISLIIMGALIVRKRLLAQPSPSSSSPVDRYNGKDDPTVANNHTEHGVYANNDATDPEFTKYQDISKNYLSQSSFVLSSDHNPDPDHKYDTLGKGIIRNMISIHISTDDELQTKDTQNVGYEAVSYGKEPGYETLKSSTYVDYSKEKENDYETLKEKDPCYETIKDSTNSLSGYETIGGLTTQHGYETIKPKLPPPNSTSVDKVPDILQNLNTKDSETPNVDEVNKPHEENIPPQILALYAKIDKTKKRNYQIGSNAELKCQDLEVGSKLKQDTDINGAKELIRKFNSFSSEEGETAPGSMSSTSSIRPLPPIPSS